MFLLDILLNLFMGKKQSSFSPEVLVDQVMIGLKKILKSLISLFICSVLLCVLLGYLVDRTLTLLDNQNLHLSNSILFLIVLIVIDLFMIYWAIQKFNEKNHAEVKLPTQSSASSSPIESAVAALIFDFVKSREQSREHVAKKPESID